MVTTCAIYQQLSLHKGAQSRKTVRGGGFPNKPREALTNRFTKPLALQPHNTSSQPNTLLGVALARGAM